MAANTFDNDNKRAADPTFQTQVRGAVYKTAIAVIGEASSTPGRDARHDLLWSAIRQPNLYVPWLAALVAGESSIRAVDMPATVTDAAVEAAFVNVLNDAAGVKAA